VTSIDPGTSKIVVLKVNFVQVSEKKPFLLRIAKIKRNFLFVERPLVPKKVPTPKVDCRL
jgi:hypothetical protein